MGPLPTYDHCAAQERLLSCKRWPILKAETGDAHDKA
jgi:hypothetical protein